MEAWLLLAYILILSLAGQKTVDGTQKIDRLVLAMHKMKNLLVANIYIEVTIVMPFVTLSNADIAFIKEIYLKDLYCCQDFTNRFRLLIRKDWR